MYKSLRQVVKENDLLSFALKIRDISDVNEESPELGDMNLVQHLSRHNRPDMLNLVLELSASTEFKGIGPLHLAAGNGNVECVKLLLASGFVPDAPDVNGWIPVRYAEHYGHHECSRLLLDAGSDRDNRDPEENHYILS